MWFLHPLNLCAVTNLSQTGCRLCLFFSVLPHVFFRPGRPLPPCQRWHAHRGSCWGIYRTALCGCVVRQHEQTLMSQYFLLWLYIVLIEVTFIMVWSMVEYISVTANVVHFLIAQHVKTWFSLTTATDHRSGHFIRYKVCLIKWLVSVSLVLCAPLTCLCMCRNGVFVYTCCVSLYRQ